MVAVFAVATLLVGCSTGDDAVAQGGTFEGGAVHLTIETPSGIARLVAAAEEMGLEVIDIVLRRPNLESVFLHLTGRELRE